MHAAAGEPPLGDLGSEDGLVGRLAGSTVAYLAWRQTPAAMEITRVLVAPELRRLGIGRMLLGEAGAIAAAGGSAELRVAQDCKLARYFEASGFVARDGSLQKTIR
ncbi:MAG: GNAT family N-acetyltransferase [Thermoanaerobaculia bacterium]|nr:GNAT family N-acetyltransferase [Thermoanaerobaculia bacterium]